MKKTAIIILSMVIFVMLNACEEDNLTFTAQQPEEDIAFTNSFAAEYLISEDIENNLAERFVWNTVDFGASVNINYELQGSVDADFETFTVLGSSTATNLGITVGQLLAFAEELGLDDDPATTDPDTGSPNNTGQVFFRLRAFTGTGAANSVEEFSNVQAIAIVWIEKQEAGAGCSPIYALGAATDAGWAWDSPVVMSCENGVYTGRTNLYNRAAPGDDETFRFFVEEGNWDDFYSYDYYSSGGYTIDPLLDDAGDDSNFIFTGTPGIYEITIDDNEKTITLTESMPYFMVGDAVPGNWSFEGAAQLEEIAPYIRTVTADFSTGIFRFFTVEGDWGSDLKYTYFEDLEYTIDPALASADDADGNFQFVGTPGAYTITINARDKTITLE